MAIMTLLAGGHADGDDVLIQVSSKDYQKLLDCVFTSDINVCEDVPSGGGRDGAKLTNPLGGTAHQVDGADRCECYRDSKDKAQDQ